MRSQDGRSYIPVPFSVRKYLECLTAEEYKAVGDAVFAYAEDGIDDPSQLTPYGLAAYLRCVEEIDQRNAAYQRKCEQNAKNRQKGWDDQRAKEAAADPEPDPAPRPAAPAYNKPTVEDIKAFAEANGLTTINPAQFYAHCEVNEWRFNDKPLNWQAYAKFCHNKTVANQKNPAKVVSAQNYTQREYDSEFYDSFYSDLYDEARKL